MFYYIDMRVLEAKLCSPVIEQNIAPVSVDTTPQVSKTDVSQGNLGKV